MTVYFCFTAYNEERDIPPLLSRIHAAGQTLGEDYRIIVYEDGSNDATLALLQAAPDKLTLLTDGGRKGFSHGIRRLIEQVAEQANATDTALFMDADNTHDPADAERFQSAVAAGADLVIASRFIAGSEMLGFPLYRRLMSRIAAELFGMALRLPIRDYSSGFRCYRVSLLQAMLARHGTQLITRPGFECQVELLSKLPAGSQLVEIPFRYDYRTRVGRSKMRLLRTIMQGLQLFATLLARRHK